MNSKIVDFLKRNVNLIYALVCCAGIFSGAFFAALGIVEKFEEGDFWWAFVLFGLVVILENTIDLWRLISSVRRTNEPDKNSNRCND